MVLIAKGVGPESCITFCHHVFFSLEHPPRLVLAFMALTPLKMTGHVFRKISLSLDLSDVLA